MRRGYTIRWGMSGSGAMTGMVTIRSKLLRALWEQLQARTAWGGVAVGASTPAACVRRSVATARRRPVAAASVSVLSGRVPSCGFPFYHLRPARSGRTRELAVRKDSSLRDSGGVRGIASSGVRRVVVSDGRGALGRDAASSAASSHRNSRRPTETHCFRTLKRGGESSQ